MCTSELHSVNCKGMSVCVADEFYEWGERQTLNSPSQQIIVSKTHQALFPSDQQRMCWKCVCTVLFQTFG